MTVLHITNAYPTNSNSSYGIFIKEQIESLKKKGVTCDIVFINGREKGKIEYLRRIRQIVQVSKKYDIIHCHHAYSAFVALFLARVKKPMVISFLSTKNGEVTDNPLTSYFYEKLLDKCKAYIVKNDSRVEEFHPGKAYYLPNGVDLSRFKEMDIHLAQREIGLNEGIHILFSASGGIERKEKRYDIFKQVIRILNTKYNINAKELLLINVSREKVPLYFNASAVHLLTSDYEGSPNSVKEALACNVPVVSRDVGNVREIVSGIEGCYISATADPEELANLVFKSLEVGRIAGREAILKNGLAMENVADKLISIYNKAVN